MFNRAPFNRSPFNWAILTVRSYITIVTVYVRSKIKLFLDISR